MLNTNLNDKISKLLDDLNRKPNIGIICGTAAGIFLWFITDSVATLTISIIVGFFYDKFNE